MKASEAKFIAFLRKAPQFVVPIYQRTYSWTETECQQLWDDILRVGRDDAVSVHFIGSIVYIEQDLSSVTAHAPLLVIDGQQRLTTVSLLIAALANALAKPGVNSEPVDGFSPKKLRNFYLLNPDEDGERHYKLILTQTDKTSLMAIADDSKQPQAHSLRVQENFELFKSWIAESKDDLVAVCKGMAKLVVVDIALSRGQDNPQLIFESMNSTGRELTQADLIRNFILMGLEPGLQTRLYNQSWRPMEIGFGQEAYSRDFDAFMRHYLTMKTGEIPNVNDVYDAFKKYARSPQMAQAGVENLVADVHAFSTYFCAMALDKEPEGDLKRAFGDLRELKVDVAYPFLLGLYDDYTTKKLSHGDFVAAIRLVEAYVFRRAICAIPTNSLNKTFASFAKTLDKNHYLQSIEASFAELPSYRRFPSDEEFSRDIKTRDLYNFPRRSYWLRRMENYRRKELVAVLEYTIEHIMPQNEKLSAVWKDDLGPEWERVQQTWLHTLGNLTLTGYNSEYSDRPFSEKRDMKGGFKVSPLILNEGIGQLQQWDEEAIKARADKLADRAIGVWPAPERPPGTSLAKMPTTRQTGYTISDHPHLVSGQMRGVFEAFRKEVLALDPCVTEEFLKLYVAYKAETNFVDVVPQAKRLRLSLNMAFPEINDPKGVCTDVTGVGRWGNGDVEIGMSSIEDLPYVMGLVRQSLEKQLGTGEDA